MISTSDQRDKEDIRVLMASALGAVVESFLATRYKTVVVTTTEDELRQALPGSLTFDVAVVDLLWNSFDTEWTFDGLDVLDQLQASGRAAAALIAIHGYSAERDYLFEAIDHPLVRGVLVKANGLTSLADAIGSVAIGYTFHSKGLPSDLFDKRLTINRWFGARNQAAHVAGAIASGQASTWAEVAEVTPFAQQTIHGAPPLFGEALCEFGDVDDPADVNQPMIFRWCGEHAQYIVSWCRRHGLPQYARVNPLRPAAHT